MNHLALGPKKKRKLKEEDPTDQESPLEEEEVNYLDPLKLLPALFGGELTKK